MKNLFLLATLFVLSGCAGMELSSVSVGVSSGHYYPRHTYRTHVHTVYCGHNHYRPYYYQPRVVVVQPRPIIVRPRVVQPRPRVRNHPNRRDYDRNNNHRNDRRDNRRDRDNPRRERR